MLFLCNSSVLFICGCFCFVVLVFGCVFFQMLLVVCVLCLVLLLSLCCRKICANEAGLALKPVILECGFTIRLRECLRMPGYREICANIGNCLQYMFMVSAGVAHLRAAVGERRTKMHSAANA